MNQLLIRQAEENLAKRKEDTIVSYVEKVLQQNERNEEEIRRLQENIDNAKDLLDKIASGDETTIKKILLNSEYGCAYSEIRLQANNFAIRNQ